MDVNTTYTPSCVEHTCAISEEKTQNGSPNGRYNILFDGIVYRLWFRWRRERIRLSPVRCATLSFCSRRPSLAPPRLKFAQRAREIAPSAAPAQLASEVPDAIAQVCFPRSLQSIDHHNGLCSCCSCSPHGCHACFQAPTARLQPLLNPPTSSLTRTSRRRWIAWRSSS